MNSINDNSSKGILHARIGEQKYMLQRFQPSSEVDYFVQHYWVVKWDLRGQEPYSQIVLSHPNVNLVVESGKTRIYGIPKISSTRLIEGHGWVIGVKFKPGGFYPFWNKPISRLTDQSVSFQDVFDIDSQSLEEEILAQEYIERAVKRLDTFFSERLPEPDQNVQFVSDIVQQIKENRSIMKVEDAAHQAGMHIRTMQRLFDRYVGVSPKWVIQRYRLHEAAELLEQEISPDWTKLCLELGYYDQSHFIRAFKSVVGRSPEEYIREQ